MGMQFVQFRARPEFVQLLRQMAEADGVADGDGGNVSRTIRLCVLREAQRRGLPLHAGDRQPDARAVEVCHVANE